MAQKISLSTSIFLITVAINMSKNLSEFKIHFCLTVQNLPCEKSENMTTGSSALPENRCCVRSVSLPTRSHPLAVKIEDYLSKSKTWEGSSTTKNNTSSAETIQVGLVGLAELYNCVDDFIHLPLIQQVLVNHQHEKSVEEALDESVSILDVCGIARDTFLTMKEGVKDLQSALRRKRGGQSSMRNQTSAYLCLRKKMKKDVTKCLAVLKKLNEKNESLILNENHHLAVVVRVLREISSITISIFRCLLLFFSVTEPKRKLVGWSLVSKAMKNKSAAVSEKELEHLNEVELVDVAVHALFGHNLSTSAEQEKVEIAQRRLKALEITIERLENGLACMYRCIIQTRVSILNALNH